MMRIHTFLVVELLHSLKFLIEDYHHSLRITAQRVTAQLVVAEELAHILANPQRIVIGIVTSIIAGSIGTCF